MRQSLKNLFSNPPESRRLSALRRGKAGRAFEPRDALRRTALLNEMSIVISQPANQQLALINHFRRQAVVKIEEEFFMSDHFGAPC